MEIEIRTYQINGGKWISEYETSKLIWSIITTEGDTKEEAISEMKKRIQEIIDDKMILTDALTYKTPQLI